MAQSDTLYRYLFENYQVRGELVQLDQTLQTILNQQHYPSRIRQLLAEMLAATSLLTATLKFEGDITVQMQGQGPLHYIAINGNHRQQMRGVARWDETRFDEHASLADLIGEQARLVITITPANGERYQGMVALDPSGIAASLEHYFAQSEQLPTRIWLFYQEDKTQPCCGGMLVQQLPANGSQVVDDFQHVCELTHTMTHQEFFTLPTEELLYRLYHQEQVQLFEPQPISFSCTCSKERCQSALFSMDEEELLQICEEQGAISMHCEFCGTHYHFNKADITRLFHGSQSDPIVH
ncbi:Hsp33 family molecular chaperone HslO [Celerinatantimonas sp. YJH-8]|uniref:Hsp33 family molecular chaperone HslO n=1 Tax=Celerinatantimonas sp. YJH-8 TaxID=3228714 RepID=UPI0038C555BA